MFRINQHFESDLFSSKSYFLQTLSIYLQHVSKRFQCQIISDASIFERFIWKRLISNFLIYQKLYSQTGVKRSVRGKRITYLQLLTKNKNISKTISNKTIKMLPRLTGIFSAPPRPKVPSFFSTFFKPHPLNPSSPLAVFLSLSLSL